MTKETFIHKWSEGPWQNLVDVIRYSTLPVIHRESVAEHTFFVAFYCYAIALDLLPDVPVKLEILLRKALMHDLDEAVTGDVIRPVKYRHPDLHAALQVASTVEMLDIVKDYAGMDRTLFNDWMDAKDKTLEGHIVHLADGWSCVTFARREIHLGNKFALTILENDIVRFIETFNWKPELQSYVDGLIQYVKHVVHQNG